MKFGDTENPPTYEDSIGNNEMPTLASRVASAQKFRIDLQEQSINKLLVTVIEPFLEHLAVRGIEKASLIAVPVDARDLQYTNLPSHDNGLDKAESSTSQTDTSVILGFPTGEYLQMIRLDDLQDTCSFWGDPHIIESLQARITLLVGAADGIREEPRESQHSSSSTVSRKTKLSRKQTALSPSSSTFSRLTTRGGPPPTSVAVRLQEVSIRVPAPMDLWEVRNGDALVISINIPRETQ